MRYTFEAIIYFAKNKFVLSVFACAIVLWLLVTTIHVPHPFRYSDSRAYWFEANSLIKDGNFREPFDTGTTPSTWRPPLTGVIVSLISRVFGSPIAVVRIQQILLLFTSFLLFLCMLTMRLRTDIAMVFVLIYLWNPSINDVASTIMSETWFMFFWVLSLLCAINLKNTRTILGLLCLSSICGICAGFALLTRTVFVALLATIVLLLLGDRYFKSKVIASSVFFMFMGITIAPWTIRNFQLHRQLVFINTAGSYNFYLGNVHDADKMPVGHPDRQTIKKLRKRYGELKTQQMLEHIAKDHIFRNKLKSAKRWAINVLELWLSTKKDPRTFFFSFVDLIGKVSMLGLSLISFIVFRRKQIEAWALICTPVFLTMLHAVTFVTWRFWIPAAPACILLAAKVVNNWVSPRETY